VVILREGSTGGFYLDPEDARAADLRPTGHVLDGRLQPSNLILRPGGRSRNAIGMDLGDYLCLEVFHTDPLVDVATGALSTTCDLLLYRNHHFRGAIPGVRLDTHVTGLLRDVREVASDQLRLEEVDACPLILAPRVFTP
jgi:predicted Zn-dependent protease